MLQFSHPFRNFIPEINYSMNKLGYNSLILSSNSHVESPSSVPHCTFTNAISFPLNSQSSNNGYTEDDLSSTEPCRFQERESEESLRQSAFPSLPPPSLMARPRFPLHHPPPLPHPPLQPPPIPFPNPNPNSRPTTPHPPRCELFVKPYRPIIELRRIITWGVPPERRRSGPGHAQERIGRFLRENGRCRVDELRQ